MSGPRAAKGPFPYLNHRTVAEVDRIMARRERARANALERAKERRREALKSRRSA